MTEVLAPPVGEVLSAETARKGDLVRYDGHVLPLIRVVDGEPVLSFNGYAKRVCAGACTFIGRPDAEGWIKHEGGTNPVPGIRVDVEHEGKWVTEDVPSDQRADLWRHDDPEDDMNIIAFRLSRPSLAAPTVQGGEDFSLLRPEEAFVPDMNKSGDASLRETEQ